jgi:hypothetical protein
MSGASVREDSDVQLGQCGGVCEKDLVWLLALSAPWDGFSTYQAVSAACRPVMVRSGAVLPIRTVAPGQAEVV